MSKGSAKKHQTMMRSVVAKHTDPIFPAIEAHRSAWSAYRRATKRFNEDAKIDPFFDAEFRAWHGLMKTVPTTAIGAAALARYVSRYRQLTCETAGSWEIASLIKTLRNVAAGLERADGA